MTLTTISLSLQGIILLVLQLAVLVGGLAGLVITLRTRPDAFTAAGKLSRGAWGGILAGASLVVLAFGVLQLLGLVATVAVVVWWVDVRPALQRVLGRGRSQGPYGPW